MNSPRALVSIHDLMPHTMARVESLLQHLARLHVPPVTLLVVPGQPWTQAQLGRLRELSAAGHELAAHGWYHRTQPRRLWHRVHSLLVSRDVAEHLALDGAGIAALMRRSSDWFQEHHLPLPTLYVPPAWALGSISSAELRNQPFRLLETTRGLLQLDERGERHLQPLPLAGFEADQAGRALFLRGWNRSQAALARRRDLPLRISIHPRDLELRLADQLLAMLKAGWKFERYGGFGMQSDQ